MRIFFGGDVMTGRGIDQILQFPSGPRIYEPYVKDAREYLTMSERLYGPIVTPVGFNYIWGGALDIWDRFQPDIKIVNLETAVTHSEDAWPYKGINYRMSPENVPCLKIAGIDCCALANNHILDWGYSGLFETVEVLNKAGIKTAGAGMNLFEAAAPCIMHSRENRQIALISMGMETSGVPLEWAATDKRPGIFLIDKADNPGSLFENIFSKNLSDDTIITSIHWGNNWVYEIPRQHKELAHMLIDRYDVDIIHGHSSHHALGVEVYKGHLILYGCGDFITDYEGISGYETFRGDLSIMYFADLDNEGKLISLRMYPMQVRNFRLNHISDEDMHWLENTLNAKSKELKNSVKRDEMGFTLQW
jgi:poly-gamma-glutamate synthesis protein (capsule biosynthesis protein)